MSTLSVCIVTYNEASNIGSTLNTVLFANEIIIIDSNSSDNTVDICKKYTNAVYSNAWEGCGIQKQLALSKANCEWVLILDADEKLSLELQQEIQNIIKSDNEYAGFLIPFRTFYLNQELKYGSCYKEKHLRLFRRQNGNIVPNYVHFGLEVKGKIGKLNGTILHYSFPNIDKALNKMNLYSSLGAKDKFKSNKNKPSILCAIFHGLFTFIKCYLLKFGFLDGKLGFIFAITNAEGSYYKYIKWIFIADQKDLI